MCAEFVLRRSPVEIALELGAVIPPQYAEFVWPEHIRPSGATAAVFHDGEQKLLVPMRFSLVPSWSKEEKPKFATHNARIETVLDKATWKRPFLKQRCIVPLTQFVEPIYTGELAGHMVAFAPENGGILATAAVYDRWTNPATKEQLLSFALLTGEPSPFVAEIGHDRQPIFLPLDAAQTWIAGTDADGEELRTELLRASATPPLTATSFRAMRPGWEKRIPKAS